MSENGRTVGTHGFFPYSQVSFDYYFARPKSDLVRLTKRIYEGTEEEASGWARVAKIDLAAICASCYGPNDFEWKTGGYAEKASATVPEPVAAAALVAVTKSAPTPVACSFCSRDFAPISDFCGTVLPQHLAASGAGLCGGSGLVLEMAGS